MRKINNNSPLWLIVALIVLAGALTMFGVVWARVLREMDQAREVRAGASSVRDEARGLTEERMLLKQHASDIDLLQSYFIRERDVVMLTERLEGFGKAASVDMRIDGLDTVALTGGAKALTLHIHATGTFAHLVTLLKLIENSPMQYDFTNVVLARDAAGKGGEWNFDATFLVYNFTTE